MRTFISLLAILAAAQGQDRDWKTFRAPLTGLEAHVARGGSCDVRLDGVNELTAAQARALGLSGATAVTVAEGVVRRAGDPHPVSAMFPDSGWKGSVAGVPVAALKDARLVLSDGERAICWVRVQRRSRIVVSSDMVRPHEGIGLAHNSATSLWSAKKQPGRRWKNATALFDGSSTKHWVTEKGGAPCPWKVVDGTLEVTPGKGSIMTRGAYGDFRMHVEFNVPEGKGNSGVYLQRRYEVQILNTPGLEPKPHFCGALYRYRKPDRNLALPVGVWQTFDITFRQPRWKDGKKVENAQITVVHNGVPVHDRVELTRKTGAGKPEGPQPMPILLQDHGWKIRFRNIWIAPLE